MSTSGSDSGSSVETAVAPPGSARVLSAATPPRLGGALGRYELIEVLGHGAMATVFRARDTQLSRDVAVKVMTLAVAARADSAERFRREARAVAAVKHPGIVEIFDFVAATDTDPAYIVSELIKGPTLRKLLDERRGRLLPESAALIAMALADALQAAHARGVVHRDIKPDNVMLEREGGGARVVLADFGVAQVTGMETMTATGALVGSPSYMSPEQGRGEDVGPASDLFSLGVLLYEMATGVLPFAGRDPLTVLAAISRGVFKRPSAVSRFAGVGIDEICVRCLRGSPGERYGDASALAVDLRRYGAETGVGDPVAGLRTFLTDPDGFEAALRPRVAEAAVASARRHARRGELAKALAHLSRATAYVPGHAEAERLIARISSRRTWAKIAAMASGVAVIGLGVWSLSPWVRAKIASDAGGMVAGETEGTRKSEIAGEMKPAPASATVGPSRDEGRGLGPRAEGAKEEETEPKAAARETGSAAKATTNEGEAGRLRTGEGAAGSRTSRTRNGARSGAVVRAQENLAGTTAADRQRGVATNPGVPTGGESEGSLGAPSTIGSTAAGRTIGPAAGDGVGLKAAGTSPATTGAGVANHPENEGGSVSPPASATSPSGPAAGSVGIGPAATASPTASETPAAMAEVITVVIYAENAFCTPSLDRRPPRRTPARYAVPPGTHQIHCQMPGGGRWSSAIEIAAPEGGGSFRVQLRRDSQGRPTIDPITTSKPASTAVPKLPL